MGRGPMKQMKQTAGVLKHRKQIWPSSEIPLPHSFNKVGITPGLAETREHKAPITQRHKETLVATNISRHVIGSSRSKTPVKAIATLLAIYTAFYLTVIGVVHFMASPDAMAAIAPDITAQRAAAPHVPPEAIGASGELPAARLADPATSAATDNARECARDAHVETECIFN